MLGRTAEPFDLQFTEPDGTEVDGAFLIQVSNNPYVLGASPTTPNGAASTRGTLGVFAITAATGREAAARRGPLGARATRRSRHWHEFTGERFEIRSRSGTAYAGIDGEALELATPLDSGSTRGDSACSCLRRTSKLPSAAGTRRAHRRSVRDHRGP